MHTQLMKLMASAILMLGIAMPGPSVASINYSSYDAAGSGFSGDAQAYDNTGWTYGRYDGTEIVATQRSRGFRGSAWETEDEDVSQSVTYMFAEWYWYGIDGWTVAYSKVSRDSNPSGEYGRGDCWQ